jgi:predicted N-acetyltransferase YhbS
MGDVSNSGGASSPISSDFAIRRTVADDFGVTEYVTREAFWNVYGAGCDEHYLLQMMRGSDGFIPELDLVAVHDGEIVGNVVCNRAIIETDASGTVTVLALGPIAVHPKYQGKRIGSRLIEEVKNIAPSLGFEAILLYGDPNYYSRLGFLPAESLDIRTADNMYAEPLQVVELRKGTLNGRSGRYIESDYEIDDQKVIEFDKQFAPKEMVVGLPSQQRFHELLKARRPRDIGYISVDVC